MAIRGEACLAMNADRPTEPINTTLTEHQVSEALFISDLHLSGERPDTVRLFLQFLEQRAPRANSLYILGDLFDAWIGDDLDLPPIPQVKSALRALSDSGTKIHLMHGNRDFLLGDRFCAETGSELLVDPSLIDLQRIPTLLMHGDTLCTDDQTYQAFRQQIRDPAFIQRFLTLPIPMDVNQQAVEDALRQHGALRLIHGHTHRPDLHRFSLDGRPAQRYVLAEWHAHRAGLLSITPTGWQRETFTLE
jgi:UDP-2,3-diacylglucosamine hydrolase